MIGELIRRKRLEQAISQDALANGICAVSYLSKIENNKVDASPEIIELLFNRLNIAYINDERVISEFEQLYSVFKENQFYYMDTGIDDALLCLARKLIYSRCFTQALIVLYINGDRTLEINEELLRNDEDRVLYLTEWAEDKDFKTQIKILNHLALNDAHGYALVSLMWTYFIQGDYQSSIETAQKVLQQFLKTGNIIGQYHAITALAFCYSNMFQLKKAEYYYKQMMRIDRLVDFLNEHDSIAYNYGSTLLMMGYYDEALQQFLSITEEESRTDYYYHKLGLCYVFLHEPEKALTISEHLTNSEDNLSRHIGILIRYMALHAGFIKEKEYITQLELCLGLCQETEQFFGRQQFFAFYLYHAYREGKAYKKALQLNDKFNISSNF